MRSTKAEGLRTLLMAGGALAMFAAPTAFAHAAEAGAPDAPVASAGIEEVVVTARKREERLKDIPIAVTAVTSDTIERQQIYAVKDIAAFAPGLTINSDAVGRAFVSIRGVGATLIDTVQPGVGIFIDGIYQPNTSYLNSPLLDVERIEVLRGPQGTLFGNNTLGGAISVITRQPSDVWRGTFTGAYAGPDNFQTASGSISGPIVPGRLQFRIGAAFHDQEGFAKNILAGGDANPLTQRSVNGTLRFEPTDNAVLTLKAYYDQVVGGQTAYADVAGVHDLSNDVTLNQNSIADYKYSGVNLKAEFDVGNTKVTAIAAYDHRAGDATGDGDFGPVPFISVHGFNDLSTYTGELRFDTKWSDRISTLIGFFADKSTTNTTVENFIIPFGVTQTAFDHTELAAQAIYGNVFFKLDDTTELTAGLRWDHQSVDDANALLVYKTDQLEPRFTFTKHWSSDVMTYASVARGFRGGGSNGPGAPNPIYKGDSVWTYEVGTKWTSSDHRLSADIAAFYNDYNDFIGQNSLAPRTTGAGFVAINLNTGKVKSYGVEIEAQWRPTEELAFSAGGTLMHARITDGSEYVATTGMALPSTRILFQPDWNGYVNGAYPVPVGNDHIRLDATVIAKGNRVGSTLSAASVPLLKPYVLVNSSIGWIHGDVEIDLFATNLFNEKYFESYLDSSLLSTAGFTGPLVNNLGIQGDRRRYGIRAKYAF
jgi:iron complex outermembrane receptor protein